MRNVLQLRHVGFVYLPLVSHWHRTPEGLRVQIPGLGWLLSWEVLIRKIHSLHSSFLISQTTIVVFKISSFIFFQNYYLTILKLLE